MASNPAPRDTNFVPAALFLQSGTMNLVSPGQINQVTGRILVDAIGGGVSGFFQTDIFTSTNNQTIFTASKNVAYTVYLSINGSIQTPATDYSVTSGVTTLSVGIPSGNVVVWCYITL
jgi:hypothetical protein